MKNQSKELDPKQQALDRKAAIQAINNLFQTGKIPQIIEESENDLNKYIQGGMKSKARLVWMGVKILFRHPRTCLNIFMQRNDLLKAKELVGDTEFQKSLLTDTNILEHAAKHSDVLESLITTYKETDASKFLSDLSKKNLEELKIEVGKSLSKSESDKISSKEQLEEVLLKNVKSRQKLVDTAIPLITGLLKDEKCRGSLKDIIVKEELLELYNQEGALKSAAKFMEALQDKSHGKLKDHIKIHGKLKDYIEKNAKTIGKIAKLQLGNKIEEKYHIHKDLLANVAEHLFKNTKNAEEILNSLNDLKSKTPNKNLVGRLWDKGNAALKIKNLFQDMQKKYPDTAKHFNQALADNNIIENKKAQTLVTYFLGGKSPEHDNSLKTILQNSFNTFSKQSKKITTEAVIGAFKTAMSKQFYELNKALTGRSQNNAAIENVEEKSTTEKAMVEPKAELSPRNIPQGSYTERLEEQKKISKRSSGKSP